MIDRRFSRAICVGVTAALLAGCGGAQPPIGASGATLQGTTAPPLAETRGLPAREIDCGEAAVRRLNQSGGTQRIAHLGGRHTLYGNFGYASFTPKKRVKSFFWSCPTDDPIAPVPPGYTADWFGSWWLECPYLCGGLTFGPAQLSGHIFSRYWSTNTTYYLYVYALYTKQVIESYQIGPVMKAQKGQSSLAFASPFESGFVYPEKDAVVLEIAHPTQP
jgi:hypothetical protein